VTKAQDAAVMSAEVVCAKKKCVKDKRKTPTVTITQIVTTVCTAVNQNNGLLQLNAQL
jgi:hypothetical protein